LKYNKYKSYIERAIELVVGKIKKAKKSAETITHSSSGSELTYDIPTSDDGMTIQGTSNITIDSSSIDLTPKTDKPVGHLEGNYWIWPDKRKTHIRFIGQAVSKYKNLPLGFYAAVEKSKRKNLKQLVMKAKHLDLKDNIEVP